MFTSNISPINCNSSQHSEIHFPYMFLGSKYIWTPIIKDVTIKLKYYMLNLTNSFFKET